MRGGDVMAARRFRKASEPNRKRIAVAIELLTRAREQLALAGEAKAHTDCVRALRSARAALPGYKAVSR